ncbi:acyl-CoA dehydrogenase [Streptomyces cinnamoneus]|uniref:Acyl-CoA dehydrogenase n=1 Tax=Streptomyces cinnamoneus TaxID=53446 RepID=A0A2G1XJN3_STRCJ|nr:acyl-CoA dehydrogenase family protein [Streptomyces cinnamoneus]PHQ51349.1 acyl-CoA dehydrogenase [Streptomyces cinnamoneus]PPT16529.1 acyl-CoA dehydrogenase [Streptomyces cinnamoneus]
MDFRPSDDQRALRAGMRDVLTSCFPPERLREVLDGGGVEGAATRELWRELGDAGLFSLRLPEEEGGVGLGLTEAVFVFEEAGRALVPGPLVETYLAAGLVPGAAEGTAVVTALDRPGVVGHLAAADAVLLFDGPVVRLLDAAGGAGPGKLEARPVRSVDPLTPLHHVLRLPRIPSLAPTVTADALRLTREAVLLTAAQQLGSSARTLEMAVSHAKSRTQFGRPIGAFQAVQHICAQMLVRTELARSSVYAASLTITASEVSGAKILADEAAVRNARDCLQLHGGLGFSWDAEVHPHVKRAWWRVQQWQPVADAEEELAAALLRRAENCSSEIANFPERAV